jgi:hypothetical protein
MRQLLLGFLLLSTQSFGQTWWHIKDNDNPDRLHKLFPSYIEIDTALVENSKEVILIYNSDTIKPEGNRFYLLSKPFVDKTSLSVNLTEVGESRLEKKRPKKIFVTTEQFNRMHSNDFIKILSKNDTIHLGQEYEAFLAIDTNKVKGLDKMTALFYDVPLKCEGNKFKISFRPMKLGPTFYDISIVRSDKGNDTIKFTHNVYGLMPAKSTSTDYVVIADKMPKFNSSEFKSFDDYFVKSLQREGIYLRGKIILSYTAMKDGSTRFEGIKKGEINDADKKRIEKIFTGYKSWTPGEDKGKVVNVNISAVYDFKE